MCLKIRVTGIIQGVGFRPFVYRIAVKNKLKGYVKNLGDAGVEILVDGNEENIQSFLQDLKKEKPLLAQIHEIMTEKVSRRGRFADFVIRKSSREKELSGSVIPPDIAICNECLKELRKHEDPRHDYFFITCTNCGPRYTIIYKLPYDRENTTMRNFPMCSFCKSQYQNPLDRRFHAQTVACPICGPQIYLTTSKGESINYKDPVRETGKLLSEGFIVAIKGYGGFHIATSTIEDKPLFKLRKAKFRKQKPFAIMARSLEVIRTFATVNLKEAETLMAYTRPIVLLNKSEKYYLSDLISPGLHNVGVMLPYTGLHYMLFDKVSDPAFVMTSANPPNQPIIKDNNEALKKLGNTVDYFLFHNRKIAHRCDDSVMRIHNKNLVYIRRSRGYAPAPIMLKEKAQKCALGLGGELNNTACVLLGKKAFLSQHIGDVENVETREFLKKATEHLIDLTGSKIEVIACDLHPKFTTTKIARNLADQNHWQRIQVQHHYAHVAALMAEHNLEEIIGICCDGYGYGVDGEAWGGEIILGTREAPYFKRVGHLEKQPLIGGDKATRYPLRMAASILHKKVEIQEWLSHHAKRFPYGEKETQLLMQQLEKKRYAIYTTSCGRILDAIAAILEICYERTYEGEPAMKLEAAAIRGENDVLKLKPEINDNVLNTTQMVLEIFKNRKKLSRADLAYSAHVYLAKGLATLAIEKALENGVKHVGFSGGTACNEILALNLRKIVEKAGLKFVIHKAVPPGDGGLSFGQAVVGGFLTI